MPTPGPNSEVEAAAVDEIDYHDKKEAAASAEGKLDLFADIDKLAVSHNQKNALNEYRQASNTFNTRADGRPKRLILIKAMGSLKDLTNDWQDHVMAEAVSYGTNAADLLQTAEQQLKDQAIAPTDKDKRSAELSKISEALETLTSNEWRERKQNYSFNDKYSDLDHDVKKIITDDPIKLKTVMDEDLPRLQRVKIISSAVITAAMQKVLAKNGNIAEPEKALSDWRATMIDHVASLLTFRNIDDGETVATLILESDHQKTDSTHIIGKIIQSFPERNDVLADLAIPTSMALSEKILTLRQQAERGLIHHDLQAFLEVGNHEKLGRSVNTLKQSINQPEFQTAYLAGENRDSRASLINSILFKSTLSDVLSGNGKKANAFLKLFKKKSPLDMSAITEAILKDDGVKLYLAAPHEPLELFITAEKLAKEIRTLSKTNGKLPIDDMITRALRTIPSLGNSASIDLSRKDRAPAPSVIVTSVHADREEDEKMQSEPIHRLNNARRAPEINVAAESTHDKDTAKIAELDAVIKSAYDQLARQRAISKQIVKDNVEAQAAVRASERERNQALAIAHQANEQARHFKLELKKLSDILTKQKEDDAAEKARSKQTANEDMAHVKHHHPFHVISQAQHEVAMPVAPVIIPRIVVSDDQAASHFAVQPLHPVEKWISTELQKPNSDFSVAQKVFVEAAQQTNERFIINEKSDFNRKHGQLNGQIIWDNPAHKNEAEHQITYEMREGKIASIKVGKLVSAFIPPQERENHGYELVTYHHGEPSYLISVGMKASHVNYHNHEGQVVPHDMLTTRLQLRKLGLRNDIPPDAIQQPEKGFFQNHVANKGQGQPSQHQ